ncbi:PREDICTED: protein PHLOEM PROTEIN 2-LIKE A8-like [Camelina sativa]|uniref:Protein PHLOEM PROTEIN 2-LIKE A8-like n=1 Tax=Camelina sativa TaxID=90675 RepID=A0ABM0Y2X1_CAMSA|nr:PREDICTED: protein PHLOEM PROTEIN 2-LIKE A8-like [Camelina sativa]
MVAPSSPNGKEGPQVFINFRGAELRKTFISHLESALKRIGVNAYIDSNEPAGENLHKLFERIEESNVALAILSSRYTESNWCLKELVKIMECVEQDNLWVIPIFYKLDPGTVKGLDGDFGIQLWNLWRKEGRNRDDRILKWDAALQGVTSKFGLVSETSRNDAAFVDDIITHVQNVLSKDFLLRGETTKPRRRGAKYWKIFPILFLVTYLYISRVSTSGILPIQLD